MAASYERSESRLSSAVKDGDSYVSDAATRAMDIAGSGPIATAFRSAAKLDVADTATYPNFSRRDLCLEWGVGKLTAIPLETGVLEFGKVTKDRRETTNPSPNPNPNPNPNPSPNLFKALNAAASAAASGDGVSNSTVSLTASLTRGRRHPPTPDIRTPTPDPTPTSSPAPTPNPTPTPTLPRPLALHPALNQVGDITAEKKEEITKAGIGALDQA